MLLLRIYIPCTSNIKNEKTLHASAQPLKNEFSPHHKPMKKHTAMPNLIIQNPLLVNIMVHLHTTIIIVIIKINKKS